MEECRATYDLCGGAKLKAQIFSNDENGLGEQTGDELNEARDISSYVLDLMFKYQGWMLSSEWLARKVDDPLTYDQEGGLAYLITGYGWNTQLSRILTKRTELATRYTLIVPDKKMAKLERQRERVLLVGVNYYLNGHRIKMQGNIGYHWMEGMLETSHRGNYWLAMFQVEFGI